MKKFALIVLLSMMLFSSVFSMTLLEKLLLPEFKGDISTTTYKIIDKTEDIWVIEIDGVTYIYKLK